MIRSLKSIDSTGQEKYSTGLTGEKQRVGFSWFEFHARFGQSNLKTEKILFEAKFLVFDIAILQNLNQIKKFSYEGVMPETLTVVLKQKQGITYI